MTNEEHKQGEETMLKFATGEEQLFYTEPSWKYRLETGKGNIYTLEVDLTDRIALDFVTDENAAEYESTGDFRYKHSVTRLIIQSNEETGHRIGFLMTVIPSPSFTKQFYRRMNRNTYLNRDPDFDGLIVYHNLDGTFSNGWKYVKGEIVTSLIECTACENMISYQAIPASYKVAPLPITRNGGESIYGGELGEVVIIGHTGDDSGGGYGDGGYSGDGDGGYSGGGSGGGSSGGSNPPPQTPTPTTPCEFRSTMQADTSFNSNMLIYYEKSANDSLEDGYIKRTDGLLQLPTERNNKSLGYSALLHTHPIAAGGAPLFSAEDVYALNTMYKKGYIDNATNFRYIVASPYAIIVLQITDETKYAAFTNTYHNNLENLQNKWNESMTGNNVGEVDNMMRAFMTFLNSSNSGLSFIAGNVDENNVINWNVKEINNNTISNKECN